MVDDLIVEVLSDAHWTVHSKAIMGLFEKESIKKLVEDRRRDLYRFIWIFTKICKPRSEETSKHRFHQSFSRPEMYQIQNFCKILNRSEFFCAKDFFYQRSLFIREWKERIHACDQSCVIVIRVGKKNNEFELFGFWNLPELLVSLSFI